MPDSYDLTHLDSHSFEQMVNILALRVLGNGHTGFGPGPDGGRDGFFEGSAPYPSETHNWSGTWYIQSKFHKPHLSKDPQKWLIERVEEELRSFKENEDRKWPDNWIIATNIDPSGSPGTGSFDKAKEAVRESYPSLADRFHIWGGRKIIDLLVLHDEVATHYGHYLTPGNVIKSLYDTLNDDRASIEEIVRFLVIKEFENHQFTKLDQAGSESDTRPGIHKLFIDLPFRSERHSYEGLIATELLRTSGRVHREGLTPDEEKWRSWRTFPPRAKTWFIQGGPGQGKSTTGQYFSQLQRAALILEWSGPPISKKFKDAASEIKLAAQHRNHWGNTPRIPINIELRDYAYWFGGQPVGSGRGVLPYLAHRIQTYVDKEVPVGLLKRALKSQQWFVVFDGLDEVPNDVKDLLSTKIKDFITDTTVECDSDIHFVCTSRPQGYSGQFDDLECAIIKLTELSPEKALECAEPVIRIGRIESEANKGISILRSSISSPAVKALMTTPLQSHIMAVVVRDGKKPPERRWQLFENFYQVIKRREANRDLPDEKIARLIREEEQLLRTIHNRLGFVLHAKSETSQGAQTNLSRPEFKKLAEISVSEMKSDSSGEIVEALMEATATRLVLVNTPDDGDSLRFDIRQLQEFFAAEFIHEAVTLDQFRERISVILGDAHWREVVHFLISAMVESRRLMELAELVQSLQLLDESSEPPSCRVLYRRLARGGLIAARLLREGVLEQDKRIRNRFRNVLESFVASAEKDVLDIVSDLDHPDSRNWLIDFCIDRLREADWTESVGAAVIASKLIRDGDVRGDEYLAIIQTKPPLYITEIYHHWRIFRSGQQRIPPHWLFSFVTRQITSGKWHLLGSTGVSSALSLIRRRKNELQDQLEQIGVPASWKMLFGMMTTDPDLVDRNIDAVAHEVREDFCIAVESVSRYGWKEGVFKNEDLNNANFAENFSAQFGLFSLAAAVHIFCKEKSFQSFKTLINLLPTDKASRFAVPHNFDPYIPFDFRNSENDDLEKITENQFESLIGAAEDRVLLISSGNPKSLDIITWRRLVAKHPETAVRVILGDWFPVRRTDPQHLEYAAPVLAAVLNNPKLLNDTNFLTWGVLINSSKIEERDFIVKSFEEAVRSNEMNNFWVNPYDRMIVPFHIHLPKEESLVPILLLSAIQHVLSKGEVHSQPSIGHEELEPLTGVALIIKSFISYAGSIQIPSLDAPEPKVSDGYAVLLGVLHPDIALKFTDHLDYFLNVFSNSMDRSFLSALLNYMILEGFKTDPEIMNFVSKLLDVSRSDYVLRKAFEPLLVSWREHSLSPTSKSDSLSSWLRM